MLTVLTSEILNARELYSHEQQKWPLFGFNEILCPMKANPCSDFLTGAIFFLPFLTIYKWNSTHAQACIDGYSHSVFKTYWYLSVPKETRDKGLTGVPISISKSIGSFSTFSSSLLSSPQPPLLTLSRPAISLPSASEFPAILPMPSLLVPPSLLVLLALSSFLAQHPTHLMTWSSLLTMFTLLLSLSALDSSRCLWIFSPSCKQ